MKTYINSVPTFKVDQTNKVVVCTLNCDLGLYKHPAWLYIDSEFFKKKFPYIDYGGNFIVKAKARCNPIDTFDEETGKRIAESRAKAKMFKIAERFYRIYSQRLIKISSICLGTAVACDYSLSNELKHINKLSNDV